ncbi:MAG: glycosyltransferase family 4 protein [Phycisphaerales bacterium]
MRILHISTRLILGGSQENTVLSCEGQARRGHEVHLAFGPIYGPEGSLLERVERFRTPDKRPISTHVVPDMIRAIHPLRDWRAYRQLIALIRATNPDIVHTHSSKAGVLGRAAAWACRSPAVIHTIHGPPFYTGQNPLVRRLYIESERFAAKRCHMIVSVADAMTNQYLAERIGTPERYITVRSGMEVETFLHAAPGEDRAAMRSRLGLADGDFVIGTVARLAHQKGHDDLLDALAGQVRSDRRWKLLWIGDGWWRERLVSKARSLGLGVAELDSGSAAQRSDRSGAQVIITGLVPPERVPGHMRAMDVLAHPSYREGLPRTVPQALLCGTPVVAYDTDGTGEACRDPARVGAAHATGLLVPPGNHPGLSAAIRWMHDHPAERAAMAQRGRAWCAAEFAAERMVADLEGVYERAIQLARGSGRAAQPTP